MNGMNETCCSGVKERDSGKCNWFKSRLDNKLRVIVNNFSRGVTPYIFKHINVFANNIVFANEYCMFKC